MAAARPVAPRAAANAEVEAAWRRYDSESRLQQLPLDQTPRARALREVERIALRYGWGSEVTRYLDEVGVTGLALLNDGQVDQLAGRMRHLVECAMTACDPPDDFPAR